MQKQLTCNGFQPKRGSTSNALQLLQQCFVCAVPPDEPSAYVCRFDQRRSSCRMAGQASTWEPCDAAHVWAAIEKRPCLPIAQVCQPNKGVRLR